MSKEILNFFIITVGILLIALMMSSGILQGLATFTYFFAKGNSEAMSDSLSELITVSAGTPGDVEIIFQKGSSQYEYNLLLNKRIVFIDSEFSKGLPLGLSSEDMDNLFNKATSSSGVDFDYSENKIVDFYRVKIEKTYSPSGLEVEIVE